MNIPQRGDYIDIHVHGGKSSAGIFIVETLMAHEDRLPGNLQGTAFTFGIHPWFLTEENSAKQLELVQAVAPGPDIIAIGEAGYDKLRGPSMKLQSEIFFQQVMISEKLQKPLIIHCVRAWDEILEAAKKLKPGMPWLIHGFRGKLKQAEQLISKGFWLSVWFEYALRTESSGLMRDLPADRFFLETDGAEVSIKSIYEKVASDRGVGVEELKAQLYSNYLNFFNIIS